MFELKTIPKFRVSRRPMWDWFNSVQKFCPFFGLPDHIFLTDQQIDKSDLKQYESQKLIRIQ